MNAKPIKYLYKSWITFSLVLLSLTGFSQDHVTMTLKNVSATSTTVDFDMFIVNDGTTSLKLSACSFGVNYAPSILNGGTPGNPAFVFVAGTRDAGLNGLNAYTVVHTLIRNHLRMTMSPQSEASSPTLAPGIEYRIGTFRFTNTTLWTTNGNPAFALQLTLAAGYTQCVATVYSNGNTITNSLNTTGPIPTGNISGVVISSIILNPAATCAVTGSGTTTAVTCVGGSDGTATITLAGTGSGAPGTYTVDGGAAQPFATNPFTISSLTAGNHTVTATVTSSGCSVSGVVVNVGSPAPSNAGTVSGASPLCINRISTYTSDGDAGGVWSSTNTAVATVDAVGVVTTVGAGTTDIRYTVNAVCNVFSFKTLTVTPFTSLAGTTGGLQVCSNATVLAAGSSFSDASCNLIAKVVPSGGSPVGGSINVCVRIEDVVHTYQSAPYVQRVYDIEPATNAAAATATITLYYTQAEFTAYNLARGAFLPLPAAPGDVVNISNIRITQYHGTGTYPGNYTGGSELINPGSMVVVWNPAGSGRWEITFNIIGFSGFYLSSKPIVLPISLLNFSGKNNGNYNLLDWATSSEQNSNYFELQRSVDGINYVHAATVTAAGNSSITKLYSYSDNITAINTNLYYYRLKMVDITGSIKYSSVVKIRLNSKGFYIEATPNPFADQLRINIETELSENAMISLNDISGRKIQQKESQLRKGNNAIQLNDLGNIPSGVYLLTIITDSQRQTVKVIKQ